MDWIPRGELWINHQPSLRTCYRGGLEQILFSDSHFRASLTGKRTHR